MAVEVKLFYFLGTKRLLQITLPSVITVDSLEACQTLDNLSLTDTTPTLIVKKTYPFHIGTLYQ